MPQVRFLSPDRMRYKKSKKKIPKTEKRFENKKTADLIDVMPKPHQQDVRRRTLGPQFRNEETRNFKNLMTQSKFYGNHKSLSCVKSKGKTNSARKSKSFYNQTCIKDFKTIKRVDDEPRITKLSLKDSIDFNDSAKVGVRIVLSLNDHLM